MSVYVLVCFDRQSNAKAYKLNKLVKVAKKRIRIIRSRTKLWTDSILDSIRQNIY